MPKLKYRRVLLKISGQGFCTTSGFGIEPEPLRELAVELKETAELGLQLAVVCGGGNFLRGETLTKQLRIPRATADYMGMLATLMNAVCLQEQLEALGQPTRVMSAIAVHALCEPFIHRRAQRHLQKGRIIILAGGPLPAQDVQSFALVAMGLDQSLLTFHHRLVSFFPQLW